MPNMLLKDAIVEGLLDGKANDVVCLDMRNIDGSICDYFVIGHGDSATHIEGINRAVYKKCMKELKKNLGKRKERKIMNGYLWIMLMLLHIFFIKKQGLFIK